MDGTDKGVLNELERIRRQHEIARIIHATNAAEALREEWRTGFEAGQAELWRRARLSPGGRIGLAALCALGGWLAAAATAQMFVVVVWPHPETVAPYLVGVGLAGLLGAAAAVRALWRVTGPVVTPKYLRQANRATRK